MFLLPLGRYTHERRNPPVGRVHDERGAMVRRDLETASIHPVFVIGAVDVDFRAAVAAIAAQVVGKLVLKLLSFAFAEDVFGCDSSRTLERRAGRVVPRSLEIGIAPRCAESAGFRGGG